MITSRPVVCIEYGYDIIIQDGVRKFLRIYGDILDPSKDRRESNGIFWIVIVAVGLLMLYILLLYLGGAKCPSCKSRKADAVSRKFLREEVVYFKVKEQIKEYENPNRLWGNMTEGIQYTKPPERVSFRERTLPGKRKYYRVEYRCNNCGERFFRKEYVDEKPLVKK